MKINKKSLIKKIGYLLVDLSVLYCVSLLVVHGLINKKMSEFQKAGRKTAVDEFVNREVIPDHDNAALIYDVAASKLQLEKYNEENLFEVIDKLATKIMRRKASQEEIAEYREIMELPIALEVFALLGEVIDKKGCCFDRVHVTIDDLSNGLHIMRFVTMKNFVGAKLMTMEDRYGDAAWDNIILQLEMINDLQYDFLAFSQVVRGRYFMRLTNLIIKMLDTSRPTPEQVAAIKENLKEFESNQPLKIALDSEVLYFGDLVMNHQDNDGSRLDPMSEFYQSPFMYKTILKPLYYLDYLAYLSHNQYCYEALDLGESSDELADYKFPSYAKMAKEMKGQDKYSYQQHAKNLRKIREVREALAQ